MKQFYKNLFLRIWMVLIGFFIFNFQQYYLFYYYVPMVCSIEFLTSQKKYVFKSNYFTYNVLFVSYLTLVVIERVHVIPFSTNVFLVINILEHIFFALIVCFKIEQYLVVFYQNVVKNRIILISILFNIIGIMNEIFQNYIQKHELLFYHFDSIKDICMNFSGTVLFILYEKFKNNK